MQSLKNILCCSTPRTSKEESIGMPQLSERNLLQSERSNQQRTLENQRFGQKVTQALQKDTRQIQLKDIDEQDEIMLPSPSKTSKQNQSYLQYLEKMSVCNYEEELNIPDENSDLPDEELIQTALRNEFNSVLQEHFLSVSSNEVKKEFDSLVYSTDQQSFKKNSYLGSIESPKEEYDLSKVRSLTQETYKGRQCHEQEKEKSNVYHFSPSYNKQTQEMISYKNSSEVPRKYI